MRWSYIMLILVTLLISPIIVEAQEIAVLNAPKNLKYIFKQASPEQRQKTHMPCVII